MEESNSIARIAVYIGDFRLEGDLHVGTEVGGRKRRVSDVLNGESAFVSLTDVAMTEANFMADEPERHEIIIIRKGEISFVVPLA